MTDMITTRPVTGKMEKPYKGEIQLPVNKRLWHVGADLYEVFNLKAVKLVPPTVVSQKIRFRINAHIAKSDLRELK